LLLRQNWNSNCSPPWF